MDGEKSQRENKQVCRLQKNKERVRSDQVGWEGSIHSGLVTLRGEMKESKGARKEKNMGKEGSRQKESPSSKSLG